MQNQADPSKIAAFAEAVLALISSGAIGNSPEEYIGPDDLAPLQELAKAAGSEILGFKHGVAFTVEYGAQQIGFTVGGLRDAQLIVGRTKTTERIFNRFLVRQPLDTTARAMLNILPQEVLGGLSPADLDEKYGKRYDFYYSAKMAEREQQCLLTDEYGRLKPAVIRQFNGAIYTEAITAGRKPVSQWDDLVFVGTGTISECTFDTASKSDNEGLSQLFR
jgi:hypothetical protein